MKNKEPNIINRLLSVVKSAFSSQSEYDILLLEIKIKRLELSVERLNNIVSGMTNESIMYRNDSEIKDMINDDFYKGLG